MPLVSIDGTDVSIGTAEPVSTVTGSLLKEPEGRGLAGDPPVPMSANTMAPMLRRPIAAAAPRMSPLFDPPRVSRGGGCGIPPGAGNDMLPAAGVAATGGDTGPPGAEPNAAPTSRGVPTSVFVRPPPSAAGTARGAVPARSGAPPTPVNASEKSF